MEKLCEFCRVLRPVVYCQADAAQLCLSCDAKVHSANALSNRHLRSLLCDSCCFRPALLHCSSSDHNIYTCTSCDKALHSDLPQHQRRPIDSYIGCPSVKDFAALWDLDLNQWIRDDVTAAAKSSFMSCTASVHLAAGSSKHHHQANTKILEKSQRKQQPTRSLVQQIMDLKKLQLDDQDGSNGGFYSTPLVHGKEDNGMSSSSSLTNAAMRKKIVEETCTDNIARLQDTVHPHVVKNHPLHQKDLNDEPFPTTPFTLESLQSTVEGDSFWQCRIQTNQFLSQNMQDLGVCEDLSRDDFNIPDVDVTFQNYEELFGGDSNNINDMLSCSSVDRKLSSIIAGLEEGNASYCNICSARTDFGSSSGQSNDNIARSCLFPYSVSHDHHFHDEVDAGPAVTLNTNRKDATKVYKDKKKVRLHEKKTQHASTALPCIENADVRKRAMEGEVRMQRFRYH